MSWRRGHVRYMLYFGVFIVNLIIFLIWREYSLYLKRELNTCRIFRTMLRDMRDKMRCYLESPRVWALGYEDDVLLASGFLYKLRHGCCLNDAYTACKDGMCISGDVDTVLRDFFTRMGDGYLDTELMAIDSAISGLSECERVMADESAKKSKVAGAVLGAFAVGMIILVM